MATKAELHERMAALTKRQSTESLLTAWDLACPRWIAAEAGSGDASAYLLTMNTIEWKLFERGLPFCEECSAPCGRHVPGLCPIGDAIKSSNAEESAQ